jgi:hypothetical protein
MPDNAAYLTKLAENVAWKMIVPTICRAYTFY